MGDLTLRGATSGSITITPTAVAGTNTITLPASTGTVALTASPTFTGTVTATTVTSPAATALTIQSAGTTAMTIGTTQNVGIGTTSPQRRLDIEQLSTDYQFRMGDTSNYYDIGRNTSDGLLHFYGSQAPASGYVFDTVNGERMRIDTSGNLLVGTTAGSAKLVVAAASGTSAIIFANNTTGSGNQGAFSATLGSTANNAGSYHFAGTTGASSWYLLGNGTTSYSSDERLKKNITTTRDGYLDDICKLRVVKYQWAVNDDSSPTELGLIAQEVEGIFPGLVQDALFPSEDGIAYKTLKGSVLPVILLKAIQELSAKNDALEARLAALEAK